MARKDITMTPDEVLTFLAEGAKTLHVATIGRDGSPHLAPMWFVLDDGRIVFRSFTKSQKIVNLRRDPRLTVLVEEGDSYETLKGVMVRGKARLVDDPSYVLEIYGRLGARYPFVGDIPVPLAGEALEQAFGRFADKNTAVVVEATSTVVMGSHQARGSY
jgi:PPOX class probable F420-dependent enzyme